MISAREFAEWRAYDQLDPFGEERGDLRNAILCQLIANALVTKGKKPKVDDFMPKFDQPITKRQTPQQMRDILRPWSEQLNALHASGARPR